MIDKSFVRIAPYKPTQKLFRYLELDKLIFSFLHGGIPLVRLTVLSDEFEGSIPSVFLERAKEYHLRILRDREPGKIFQPVDYIADRDKYLRDRQERAYQWRRNHFVSCWHANDHESEAMWRLYSQYNKGVAIQTDIATLARELPGEYENQGHVTTILISRMNYIDFANPPPSLFVPGAAVQEPELLKRVSFAHEKEIRVHAHPMCGWGYHIAGVEPEIEGDYILLPAKIDELVHKIIVSPGAPTYYYEFLVSLVEHFGYAIDVEKSTLAGDPCHVFWGDVSGPSE